jgi:hypothetical protein
MKDKNEKQVMLRGGHWQRGRVKGRKKVMYFPYKNKYRIFKTVEVTIRRELRPGADGSRL